MAAEAHHGYADLGPEVAPEQEFLRSKALLQSMHGGGPNMHDKSRQSDPTTGNLYEHLVTVLKYILERQPTHALDQFEEYSYQIKRERGGGAGGSGAGAGLVVEDIEARAPTKPDPSEDYANAKVERSLLKHPKNKSEEPPFSDTPLPAPWGGNFDDDEEIARLQNLGSTTFLVDQAGIGLARTEMLRVWLSIRKLSLRLTSIAKLRFWGKIIGIQGQYYIAEGEFEAGSDPDPAIPAPYDDWRPYAENGEDKTATNAGDKLKDVPEIKVSEENEPSPKEETEEMIKLKAARELALQNLPKNKWCPRAPIPPEERGRGLNRWDYFVCTRLGSDEWFRLPPVRPEHIQHARYIRRLFTGRPDAPIPKGSGGLGDFPGLEAHLLRAQIARITAASWIAPAGLYEIDEEAELEEGEQPETLMEVEDFEPPEFTDLLDRNNWQHTRPYILRQGRCSFVNQKRAANSLADALREPKEMSWIDPITFERWTQKFNDKEENDEAMEEEDQGDETMEEPEEGPGLLGTIEEDSVLEPIGQVGLPTGRATRPKAQIKLTSRPVATWRVRPSTVLLPKNCAVAIAANGRWPGAYALARGADFVNIYVGWGQKALNAGFTPPTLTEPMIEFKQEEILVETTDPTPLEEEALREAKEARRRAREARAEEAEDEENEAGEDEDDED